MLGIDVGGTGLRGAIAPPFGVPLFRTDRTVALRRGAGGIEGVAPAAAELGSALLASAIGLPVEIAAVKSLRFL